MCHASLTPFFALTLFFVPGLIDAFMARVHFRNDETAVDALHKFAFT